MKSAIASCWSHEAPGIVIKFDRMRGVRRGAELVDPDTYNKLAATGQQPTWLFTISFPSRTLDF